MVKYIKQKSTKGKNLLSHANQTRYNKFIQLGIRSYKVPPIQMLSIERISFLKYKYSTRTVVQSAKSRDKELT